MPGLQVNLSHPNPARDRELINDLEEKLYDFLATYTAEEALGDLEKYQ